MKISNIRQLINLLKFKSKMSSKPYCKVCHDSGKSEKEYTSHWVKDRSGKTLCPTLLNTECRYCFKLGHTAKFCEVLAKNNKAKDKLNKSLAKDVKPKPSQGPPKKQVNSFAVLDCDSGSEQEQTPSRLERNLPHKVLEKVAPEEYPALPGQSLLKVEVKMPVVNSEVKTGWASIAAKPAEVKPVVTLQSNFVATGRDYSKPIYTKSWADWSDSDSEDEVQVKPWTTVCGTQTMSPGWSTAVADDDDW